MIDADNETLALVFGSAFFFRWSDEADGPDEAPGGRPVVRVRGRAGDVGDAAEVRAGARVIGAAEAAAQGPRGAILPLAPPPFSPLLSVPERAAIPPAAASTAPSSLDSRIWCDRVEIAPLWIAGQLLLFSVF